jgi:carboxyl-terminal processing protease
VSGIGCEIGVRNDQPTVLRVISNSPAEQAGLQVGDVFVSVNGTSVAGKDSATVALAVRGDAGTSVKLAMKRGSATNDYTITRAQVDDPSVRWSEQNGVGVMTISRFDAQTGNLATKAAQEFKSKGVKGVVVDLRDNGGGYLDAAQAVAGLWLDHKLVVTEKTNGQVVDSIMSGSNPILAGIKTVVLVNGGSASASEILSGALQDYGVATLVGEKTFGKGTVQKVMDLPDGRILKVTVARWYTPKGKNITAQGIEPDQKVSISAADSNAGRDPQLSAAMGLFS